MLMDFSGPFNIFFKLRHLNLKNGRMINFDCFFCLSTIISIPFAYFYNGNFFLYWFGFAGGALLVNAIYEYL